MDETIFISHSSKDRTVARTICDALEARGLHCWIASRDVAPGENFQESITKTIRTAKVMVLVFTKNANDSAEIKKEIALASQHELVVIPVRIEDVIPNDALAYELSTRQWIDLFQDWERAVERLSVRIKAITTRIPGASAPAPSTGTDAAAAISGAPGGASHDALSLNLHLVGSFLLSIAAFAGFLAIYFLLSNQFAGALAGIVGALPLGIVAQRTLDKDSGVRTAGLVLCIVGLLLVGVINVNSYTLKLALFEDQTLQSSCLMMGIYFLVSAIFFGWEWKKFANPAWRPDKPNAVVLRFLKSRWGAALVFASVPLFTNATWQIFYQLSASVPALVALIATQLALVGYCFYRYRRDIAVPTPAPTTALETSRSVDAQQNG